MIPYILKNTKLYIYIHIYVCKNIKKKRSLTYFWVSIAKDHQ